LIIHSPPEQAQLIRIAREVNDGKTGHVLEQASLLIDELPGVSIACFGLAFKANIDDFRESPALKIAAKLARRYGGRVKIVEPYASELPAAFADIGAELIDIDQALETCPIMITLTDHDMLKSIPLDERVGKVAYDTRGIWPDQPDNREASRDVRLAS